MFQGYVKASWAMYDKLSKALLKVVVIMTQQVFYRHFSAQNLTTARGCFLQSLTKSHVFERYVLSELNYNRKEVVMY